MTDRVRPTKLKFKGDKDGKKKRKHAGDDSDHASRRRRRRDGSDGPADETWVVPENAMEIRGPTFIVHPSDPSPLCVTFDSTRGRIVLSPLDRAGKASKPTKDGDDASEAGPSADADADADASDPASPPDETPRDVSQVWVTTRAAGSHTVSLRTGAPDGKFLSCDAHGVVSAFRDARGPQEEWSPVVLPDGLVAFAGVYGGYLAVDEVAGGASQLRCDSEQIGPRERFRVKIQEKYKREATEEERKKKEGTSKTKIDEAGTNHMYQAWGAGKSVTSQDDKTDLRKARNEGRLTEALLDRRAKLKSDRFC